MLDGKTKIIACAVVIEELRSKLNTDIECEILDFGLHRSPEQLKIKLQESIDNSSEYENIILAYGLCGMSVIGLHSDSSRLIIPRVDDCIALFLGSRKTYLDEQKNNPGSYFLSKGWIEGKVDDASPPVQVYQKLVEKYGEERAQRIYSVYKKNQPLRHYKRMAFIVTSNETNLDEYRNIARERADNLGLLYEEIPGSTIFMEKISGSQWDEEFLIIEPGRPVGFDDFWLGADKAQMPQLSSDTLPKFF